MTTSVTDQQRTDATDEDERQARRELPPMWERAECTCPDFCERDHEQD